MNYDLLIQRVIVIDPGPEGVRVRADQDILIQGPRIAAVQPTGQVDPAAAARVISGEGMVAMPGLINTHAHAAMVLFRGSAEDVPIEEWFNEYIWAMETNLTPEDIYWGTMLAAVEMIESGITTVADHYFEMDLVAEAFTAAGLRAHLAWAMFGQRPREELDRTAAFAARWHGAAEDRIRVWMGPHAPYTCPFDFLQEVAREARRLGLGVHIHVSETTGQVQASLERYGLTPIALLERAGLMEGPLLCAHAAHATPEEISLMAAHQVGVAHCPKTFLKLAAGIAPVITMRRAGIPVGLGTDGAASNNTSDLLEQMRLAALLQKHERQDARALPLQEALTMATWDGARALGEGERLGRLAPGYLADLILVRLDGAHVQPMHRVEAALVYSVRASDVDTVIVNGKVIMEGRRLLTLNKEEILRQVQARADRLVQRAHGRRLQIYR
ncbi:MAG TPA: amidohydrolase [Thermoflexus sp.]|nr:amidohydrolase [Thermoflexus sp.]